MQRSLPVVCLVSAATVACLAPAAQAMRWNRKVEGVTVSTDATGLSEIVVYYSVHADAPSAPLDLGTEMHVLVNGTVIDVQSFPVFANPSTHSGCAGIGCLTNQACFCCEVGGVTVCGCGAWIAPSDGTSTATLRPEDYIEVLLRPSPGALPDEDTSDDLLAIDYHGAPILWNRRIDALAITPSPGDDQFFDVFVDVGLQANYDGPLALDAELDVLVNGAHLTTVAADLPEVVWSQCSTTCAAQSCSGGFGDCSPFSGREGCGCQGVRSYTIPSIPATPGDEIVVILRPVPGALPELPGFGEDDEGRGRAPGGCRGDVTGNGFVDFADLLAVLAAWGPCAGCPEDFDGNNVVDFADLLVVLAAWGPCEPV